MNHTDHVNLLRKGVTTAGGVWGDIGCGRGAFTLALAELIGPGSVIYAVDQDEAALKELAGQMANRFPAVSVYTSAADFRQPLSLPPLDGLLMANSLHFLRRKEETVRRLKGYLKPGGRFLLVEYGTDRGNPWVPHPLSFDTWQKLAGECGLEQTQLLASRPSRFLGEIYAAASGRVGP